MATWVLETRQSSVVTLLFWGGWQSIETGSDFQNCDSKLVIAVVGRRTLA